MKTILNHLFEHKVLDRTTAKEVLMNISLNQYNQSQISAFLSVYLMRAISVEELAGFRDALIELCLQVDLSDYETIDVCGTGGDAKNTFNISTLTAFVVAGAGYKVAKHGNYGVSSSCGSSNLMEYFDYKFTNDQNVLRKQIEQANICFLHAPLFHPAMKTVAPIRRELGVKTFFNMLGPLVNPCQPPFQLIGVFSLELARLYHYLLQGSEKSYTIIHSLDGYDELSLTGAFKKFNNQTEEIIYPEEIGFTILNPEELFGGESVEDAADIFLSILRSNGTPAQENIVIANAAMAVQCFHPERTFDTCKEEVKDSIKSGRAFQVFQKLLELGTE